METNIILFFSAAGMVSTFLLGGVIGWIYKSAVDTHTHKRQLNNLHPEFLDGNGSYVEEELLAVRFTDPDDLLDEDDEDWYNITKLWIEMAAKKLPNDALVTEILQKVSSAKTKKEMVELLQEYNNNELRAILIINFDDSL